MPGEGVRTKNKSINTKQREGGKGREKIVLAEEKPDNRRRDFYGRRRCDANYQKGVEIEKLTNGMDGVGLFSIQKGKRRGSVDAEHIQEYKERAPDGGGKFSLRHKTRESKK